MKRERILKKASSDRNDSPTASDHKYAGNPYGVKDVNVSQGAKVGLVDDKGKRRAFLDAKEERAPLADVIKGAFERVGQYEIDEDKYWNKVPSVDGEIKQQKFSKAKSRYKD